MSATDGFSRGEVATFTMLSSIKEDVGEIKSDVKETNEKVIKQGERIAKVETGKIGYMQFGTIVIGMLTGLGIVIAWL